ncbi:MAG: porphobilinogen synthase [Planctomycetota bacterium]|jgi:porphobilinogen synthase|nr:porphobilinogen synthase [Planctomycetota bacterium]
MNIIRRPRRLRAMPRIRGLARETRLSPDSLVLPLFVREGRGVREPIQSMPGQIRYSPDTLREGVAHAMDAGVNSFLLFGIPLNKDATGSAAWAEDGVVQTAVRNIRPEFPDAVIVTDVCLCEYTSHGHCGVVEDGRVHNDKTLALLARTAVSHIRAGADMVAPSDMMDGRVAAIRAALDAEGFSDAAIMSYAVKYASFFYGPFREAAGSAPGFGDRRGYQMDWHNRREALREAALDLEEGADILIVKPAFSFLDIVSDVAAMSDCPVAAYSVSGEYAMIKAAAAQGLVDEYGIMCESAVGAFRAGADILLTYFAGELAEAMRKGDIG